MRARGRKWVVLPSSDGNLLLPRPLGGDEDEVTGLYRRIQRNPYDLPPGDSHAAAPLSWRGSMNDGHCA